MPRPNLKQLGEAYEVLKDPEKRAAYDQLGANWQQGQEFRPPPGWDSQFHTQQGNFSQEDLSGFSDFFESLFGGGGFHPGGFHARGRPSGRTTGGGFAMRGQDIHAKLEINLNEAFHGGERVFQIQVPEVDSQGIMQAKTKTIKVKIPKGVIGGQQIRLQGQGGAGIGNGPNGDLYLEIDIAKHPYFTVEGSDLHLKLPITPWEAALGAKVQVPTLAGKIELTIPKGSQSGKRLRLKGKGLPAKSPGDLYIILQIMTPDAKTESDQELYQKMAQQMQFNPRQNMEI